MANVSNNILIGQFSVPFEKMTRFHIINPHNTVRVWFDGAMGLTGTLAIDFQLRTAEKVDDFVGKLFPLLDATPDSRPSNLGPLYTISPDRVTKLGEPLPSIHGVDEDSFIPTFYVWAEMAGRYRELLPTYMAPIIHFCHMQDVEVAWNDFNFEIFNNLCRTTRGIALTDDQKNAILAIGNRILKTMA